MEQIYTIPVNEAFEASGAEPHHGCPLCSLAVNLEANELDLILGASMMEPDIRIQTNKEGFCKNHFSKMMVRGKRLPLALMLESHLHDVKDDVRGKGLLARLSGTGVSPMKKMERLEESCYICRRVNTNLSRMIETAVLLWDTDPDFPKKMKAVPYYCLPHYRALLTFAQSKLSKKRFAELYALLSEVENKYLEELNEDVSWFCKKFNHSYVDEPWKNAKDAPERAIRFLVGTEEEL